ncbi:PilX N-terminal domain-containing pilus assembly protein [Luteimonas sp. BLCC-B24]|uniref:pilus assembly PilX family protein n=1 Tax=Luteimonas sp. BLCC-B24 TaxID=3025317 RepID=UPI00234CCF58|nr:PilX N-terminal domain-containing pilus assembly protein [Luteimonas sp. BLCC-B24]
MNSRQQQSGAVLYVALMILILMALIGIVALQVASLQERMSANYTATNMAFQAAESRARSTENTLKSQVLAGENPATSLSPNDCSSTPNLAAWNDPDVQHVRRLDLCFSWGALDVPADEAERTDQIYQITAYSRDRALFPTSEATVDTVFIP